METWRDGDKQYATRVARKERMDPSLMSRELDQWLDRAIESLRGGSGIQSVHLDDLGIEPTGWSGLGEVVFDVLQHGVGDYDPAVAVALPETRRLTPRAPRRPKLIVPSPELYLFGPGWPRAPFVDGERYQCEIELPRIDRSIVATFESWRALNAASGGGGYSNTIWLARRIQITH